MSSNKPDLINDAQRDEFTRAELDQIARDEGVENPEQLRTKADVVEAINGRRQARASASQAAGSETTADQGATGAAGAGTTNARVATAANQNAEQVTDRIEQVASSATTGGGQPAATLQRGGALAGDRDDFSREGTLAREPSRSAMDVARGDEGMPQSEAERLRREREDDAALRAGDNLDKGRPPTAEEIERANRQSLKDAATLAQEQADAILRQGQAGIGAEFQPPEGQKPVYVQRGQHVNPDGRRATKRNLMLNPDEDDD